MLVTLPLWKSREYQDPMGLEIEFTKSNRTEHLCDLPTLAQVAGKGDTKQVHDHVHCHSLLVSASTERDLGARLCWNHIRAQGVLRPGDLLPSCS